MGACCCCLKGEESSESASLLSDGSTEGTSPRPIPAAKTVGDQDILNGTPSSPSTRCDRQNEHILNNVCSNLIECHEFLHPAQCDERMKQHEHYTNEFFANIHIPYIDHYDPTNLIQSPMNAPIMVDDHVDAITIELCENLQDTIQEAGGLNNIEFIF